MHLIVWVPGDVLAYDDAYFKVHDNGTLVVDDPSRGKRTTFGPVGWLKVEQELPGQPPQVQRIR